MKVSQDPETGKILIELENWEKLDDSTSRVEDYVDGLADVISNNIGPDVAQLKTDVKNLKDNLNKLIPILQYQQLEITTLTTTVASLVAEIRENPKRSTRKPKIPRKPKTNRGQNKCFTKSM